MRLRDRFLVGRLVVVASAPSGCSGTPQFAVAGTMVTSDITAGFLAVRHDAALEGPFKAMHDDGQIPAFTVVEGELAAYGWLCTPQSSRPGHLPKSASGRYWIHYCGTSPMWRGRGMYTQTLSVLCRMASSHSGARETVVFIDVRPDNRPAVAASSRIGFLRAGTATALGLPLVGYVSRTWRPK